MKTVFSKTQEVCDVWARQEQAEARTGSNTSFRAQTLRSYGTPIARIVELPSGAKVALISSDRWSSGTSKVQGEARSAAMKAGLAIYEVPALGRDSSDTTANLEHFSRRIENSISAIERAKDRFSAMRHRAEALRLLGQALMFAGTFGSPFVWLSRNPLSVYHKQEREGCW